VLSLFENPARGVELAAGARAEVQSKWDMPVITRRLVESYKKVLASKRS
jgi:hypothetical protein